MKVAGSTNQVFNCQQLPTLAKVKQTKKKGPDLCFYSFIDLFMAAGAADAEQNDSPPSKTEPKQTEPKQIGIARAQAFAENIAHAHVPRT